MPGKASLGGGTSTGPPEPRGNHTFTNHSLCYPELPSAIQITPDVRMAFDRFLRYLKGNEPLPSMAYCCQFKLRQSVQQARHPGRPAGAEPLQGILPRRA